MERKLVFDIKIDMIGESIQLKSDNGGVSMIPFGGSVKGEIFSGIVEPCGVDTQVLNAVGIRHMSARYMLTGKDSAGNDTHIYVENNGWMEDARPSMPFHTVPTFITDSPVLAPYLHRNQFEGEGHVKEDGLHIYFFEIAH